MIRIIMTSLFVLSTLAASGLAAETGSAPKFIIPKCATPPVIDGEIGASEWQHAAAITGFKDHSTGLLDPRQVVAYVTYDDTNLYLAFDLPIYPKGAKLIADHTTRDAADWNGDDILEFLLDPFAGKYKNEESYFQFMGNSAGAIVLDVAQTPGLGLYNRVEWNGHWNFKNQVVSDRWQSELSIPLKDLGLTRIEDGAKWLAQFSRTWGAKVGWTTLSPVAAALNVSGHGAELTFRSQAPAVQLLSVAPLLNGRFGAAGEIANGNEERDFKIEASVVAGGKPIATKVLTLHLKPSETQSFSFDEPAELAGENLFHLRVTSPDGTVWQEVDFPFAKSPVLPVFPAVAPKTFVLEARHLPSSQRLWVDKVDFSNFPEKTQVRDVQLTLANDDKVLLTHSLAHNGTVVTDVAIPIPNLVKEEGEYRISVALLDQEGRALASESKTFPWKHLPFVNTKAGLSDAILPPFTPLVVRGHNVSVVGRVFSVNGLGWFDQITAEQLEPTVGKSVEPLLERPMTLTGVVSDGKTRHCTAERAGNQKVLEKDDSHVVFESRGKLGHIALKVTNRIEYDGLSWLDIELLPSQPTRLTELSFDIPLREDQATLLHEITDAIRRVYAGQTPAGTGVVWDSSRLINTYGTLGNFKPLYWLGNEDRGLCWVGESDRGWHLDEAKPAIEVVREPGVVILRLRLINKELPLDKPRVISFGLQATPVKPMPKNWRGWVAPYTAAESTNLTYFSFSPVANQHPIYAAVANAPYPADYAKAREAMDKLRAMGCIPFLYEVMQSMITDIPAMHVYQGEWQRAAYIGANSYADFRVWHLAEYLKQAGLFTFYEDNAYLVPLKDPALGLGYKREDGQEQGQFPVRKLREYLRREAAVYHELDMPNYIGVHKSTTMMPPCYSFATIAIDGEQRFMTTPETDYMDQFPLDYIRAHIMGRQFGFVPFFLSEIKLGKGQEAAIRAGTRSEFALLLLHELISWPAYALDPETVKRADQAKGEFALGAADVEFHPYWEKDKVVTTGLKEVVVTLWKRPGKALAVIANLGEAREATVRVDFQKLGLTPKTIKDFESQQALTPQGDELKLTIPRHDYRLLWIE